MYSNKCDSLDQNVCYKHPYEHGNEQITRREDNRLEFSSDRDIPISVWNRYMKKFGDRYRIFRDEIGEWGIRCKFGKIQLYSMLKKQLCFIGQFRSVRHKGGLLRKLNENTDLTAKITQEGDTEVVIMFPEEEFDSIALSLLPRKKTKYSEEYRVILLERLKKARSMKDD